MANGNSQADPNLTVLPDPNTKPILSSTPSLISINPQIATTLVWVALGFGIGVWLMSNRGGKRSLF